MPEKSNTILRAEFEYKFGMLAVYAFIKDIHFICTSHYRTPEQQFELYEKGFSKCDGYNKKSHHQLWRAKDIGILEPDGKLVYKDIPKATLDKYEILGKFWEDIGGVWGGNWSFRDVFHYQY